jgi:DNA-binding SARP family transcriptional activator/DNA-binding XRE family transcriptional regulator
MLRLRAGLSQQDLAERAGVSVRTLRALENGGAGRPRATSLHRLATALGLDAADLAIALGWVEPVPTQATGVAEVRVGVLGPLTVWHDGREIGVAAGLQRVLLGLLACQPGRVVGIDEIVDVLWGEEPPRTGAQLVPTYVAALRRLLEPDRAPATPGRRLRREAGGYRLELAADQLDLLACREKLVAAGRALADGATEAAWQCYAEAWDHWRGPVLVDTAPRLRQHPAVLSVARQRIEIALRRADVGFALAHYDRVIPALQELGAEEPLHEGLAARLMVALAGAGQQARALELFDTVRRRLDDQLGVAPGPELRDAHLRVVRGQLPIPLPAGKPAASAPSVPAQLPAELDGFVGREAELTALDELLNEPDHPGARRPLVAITGMGGLGKTSLALRWAHQVHHRFPGGQLHLDLRGHSTERPLRTGEALAYFLGGLGVPADRIPSDEAQAAALYRGKLADRPVLIMLDNAADAEQVRPLLPGGGACLALVTSRDELGGLIVRDGASLVRLSALPTDEALALFTGVLGKQRVARERPDLAALARLCAGLPLALRVAAANLALRPHHRAGDYLTRLTDHRLTALALAGDPTLTVRATFRLSVDALPADARRVFGLLGLAPVADLTVRAVAALAGITSAAAEEAMARLVAGHLVSEQTPGRYTLHDLLRLYARELGEIEQSAAEQDAAVLRLAEHVRSALAAAATLLYPHLLRLPNAVDPPPDRFDTGPDALAWLDAERANLLPLVDHLVLHGHYQPAWWIGHESNGYFFVLGRDVATWEALAGAAAAAAWAGCETREQASAELHLGMAHGAQGAMTVSARHSERAAELAERAGWTQGRAVALNNLARCHWLTGDLDGAIACLTEALRLHQGTTRLAGLAVTVANLADAYAERGRDEQSPAREVALAEAARLLDTALELHRRIGDGRNEAETLGVLAEVHRDLGALPRALELARDGVRAAEDSQDTRARMRTLSALSSVSVRLGSVESGLAGHERAVELAQQTQERQLLATTLLDLADSHVRADQPEVAFLDVCDALAMARPAGFWLVERRARRILRLLPTDEEIELLPRLADVLRRQGAE